MRAVIITAVVIVLILAIGIPVIHYTTKADKSTISAKTVVSTKTLASGRAVESTPTEQEQLQQQAQPAAPPEQGEELSAKEMLEKYKAEETPIVDSGAKVGYTVGYLIEQSKQEQAATCQPLLDAAQKKVDDATMEAEAKEKIYDKARDKLRELIDEDADQDDIDDAREDVDRAKKNYEDQLAAKYTAQDELVQVRVQCAGYLT